MNHKPIINDIGTTEAEIVECHKGTYWTLNYDCKDCPEKESCEYHQLFGE